MWLEVSLGFTGVATYRYVLAISITVYAQAGKLHHVLGAGLLSQGFHH